MVRRVAVPAPPALLGTPNMEPRHALGGAEWLWTPQLAEGEGGFALFRLKFKAPRAETITL